MGLFKKLKKSKEQTHHQSDTSKTLQSVQDIDTVVNNEEPKVQDSTSIMVEDDYNWDDDEDEDEDGVDEEQLRLEAEKEAEKEKLKKKSKGQKRIKIILLGDSAVGKSKLVERFLMQGYKPQQLSTFALTLFQYETMIDGKLVEVDFWDTAGQERFQSMHPSYYYQAHACILVFDIMRKATYKNLDQWWKELVKYKPNIATIVVANKIDLNLAVTKKNFNFANKRNLPFFYASASEGTNVVKLFNTAINMGKEALHSKKKDLISEIIDVVHEYDLKEKKEKEQAEEAGIQI